MASTLEAINVLIALTELSSRLAQQLQRVGTLICTAQAEGRDLTDDELVEITAARHDAVADWNALAESDAGG